MAAKTNFKHFQLYLAPGNPLTSAIMFETIVTEIEKAGGKLTHLRRFL